jgi:WXG100 family type VII secretion target
MPSLGGAPKIRAEYEQLASIAGTFASESGQTQQMNNQLVECLNKLFGGDWEGRGARAYFQEMAELVLPAVGRLDKALQEANTETKRIVDTFRQAEEEAEKQFQ